MENISQPAKVLKRKAEVIPDLEEAVKEARARWDEAQKAVQQKHRADELKKELAWAHVASKEEACRRVPLPCIILTRLGITGADPTAQRSCPDQARS